MSINTFSSKVLLVGDLMVDHYIFGTCNRISPEAPVPVVEIKREEYTLGGAGNVLKNLISLNCTVNILSIVGDDNGCSIVLKELKALNISDTYLIKDTQRHTSVKSRVLAENHQLIRLDKESVHTITKEQEDKLLQNLSNAIDGCHIVLFSDYNKGLLTKTFLQQAIAVCKRKNIKTLVDPKGLDFSKYNGINLIKPNKKEASLATGVNITDNDSLFQACKKLQEITNCDTVVITLSEQGIAYYSNNQLNISPTKVLEVIDVTGAGDTVLAALGMSIAAGASLQQACDFANKAASIVVSKVGSATATLEEIENRFNKN
jgi:rfaE bifunctional protein kinase chain/domain